MITKTIDVAFFPHFLVVTLSYAEIEEFQNPVHSLESKFVAAFKKTHIIHYIVSLLGSTICKLNISTILELRWIISYDLFAFQYYYLP
jgi:hypothetical protein